METTKPEPNVPANIILRFIIIDGYFYKHNNYSGNLTSMIVELYDVHSNDSRFKNN